MRGLYLLLISFYGTFVSAQQKNDSLLQNLLLRRTNPIVQKVISQPDSFRLQIIYTQIDRNRTNHPTFQNYYFNFDDSLYFNPASTVKLPLALLALEKINRIGRKEVTKYTRVQFDSSHLGQVAMSSDSTAENYFPTIAHYIRKAFLVSDNDAYNRLYQFVGQGPVNAWLHEKGYRNTRINRQFMGFTTEQNRHTNQVRFLDGRGKILYTQPAAYNETAFDFSRVIKMGRAHLNSQDSLVKEPIDFTMANIVGLEDLQRMLQNVLFPESVSIDERFRLTPDDYSFVYQYLSQYPSETNYPKYDTSQYFDSYVKFFFRNGNRQMPSNLRVFNKVGWAYGFMTDVSYVADFTNKVEFMLTATVYVNSDGILNDNLYEYKEVGWPLLYEVGQAVYQHELKRQRKVTPDLSRFRIQYETRDPEDKREMIKDVDN